MNGQQVYEDTRNSDQANTLKSPYFLPFQTPPQHGRPQRRPRPPPDPLRPEGRRQDERTNEAGARVPPELLPGECPQSGSAAQTH